MATQGVALKPPAFGISGCCVVGAVVSSFLFGYSICVLNSCLDLIGVVLQWCGNDWQSDCSDSLTRQGLVNASLYLGAAIGAMMIGRPRVSALGSRRQLVLSAVFFAIGALVAAASMSSSALITGRFISGLGLGVSAIASPVFIAEISPRERRGINAAMHGVFITLGILASIALGIPQGPPPQDAAHPISDLDAWYWRGLVGLPLILAIFQIVWLALLFPTDPPSLLVQRGETDAAREVLFRMYGMKASAMVAVGDTEQAAIALQLQDLRMAVDMASSIPRIKVTQAVWDPFLRTAVLLGGGLAAFQQLCGINGLMSYSNSLFAQAGIPPSSLTMASTAMATANVFASLLSSRLVDNLGRRTLLLIGALCQTVAMAFLTIATDPRYSGMVPDGMAGPVAVVCFTIFVMSFSFGLGAVTWLYLSEIYPMEVRGPCLSACGVINWLSSFVIVFGTRFLTLRSACHIFGLICFVGFVGTYLWVVETKGCSMDDSPLTPRSGRASSTLLTPNSSPRGEYQKMPGAEEEDSDDSAEEAARGAGAKK
mmetsp:Transcript_56706/g.164487  ORF Transcript_56706/g.164487 Transcript_56706/m.164487 type:complete len:541 (+) Transcript_56706:146-1768(+)